MKTIALNPNQIITLNDYPVHSDKILADYFNKCRRGDSLPYVPLVKKELVKKHFDDAILKEFKKFEKKNPAANYFMLDGSHRTTALTLSGCKITAIVYATDKDIDAAKRLIKTGKILKNGTLNHTLEENCEILQKHFAEKPYFVTVEQKAKRMIDEKILPKKVAERCEQ